MQIKRAWIALFTIILIFGVAYQGYEGANYFKNVSNSIKHIINYAILILVALIGYWGWANNKLNWIKKLWILLYAFAIIILTAAGIFDFFFYIKQDSIRQLLFGFRFFFTSPLPFALLMFLSHKKI